MGLTAFGKSKTEHRPAGELAAAGRRVAAGLRFDRPQRIDTPSC